MTRPFFTRERISDFELFGRHADIAIAKIKERVNERDDREEAVGQAGQIGRAIDFQDLVSRFTLDSATEFVSFLSFALRKFSVFPLLSFA